MTSQELYYLHEMAYSRILYEDRISFVDYRKRPPESMNSKEYNRPDNRMDLFERIWREIEGRSLQYFGWQPSTTIGCAAEWGADYFMAMFDHNHQAVKDMIFRNQKSKLGPSVEKALFWDDDRFD